MSTLIARIDTFTKAGRFVPRGGQVDSSEVDFDTDNSDNLIEAPSDYSPGAVEMSAIAPSGPNPQNPQQIAAGTVQTEAGYIDRGARVVGEVTVSEDARFVEIVDADDNSQGLIEEALTNADRNNNDDALVEGTVADVTAGLADKDEAELRQLLAAEQDRERPRKGVTSAIEAELAAR